MIISFGLDVYLTRSFSELTADVSGCVNAPRCSAARAFRHAALA